MACFELCLEGQGERKADDGAWPRIPEGKPRSSERQCGRMSPRAPLCFALRLCRAAGAACTGSRASQRRKGSGNLHRGRKGPACAFRAANSGRVCALRPRLRLPTDAAVKRNIGVVCGDFQMVKAGRAAGTCAGAGRARHARFGLQIQVRCAPCVRLRLPTDVAVKRTSMLFVGISRWG